MEQFTFSEKLSLYSIECFLDFTNRSLNSELVHIHIDAQSGGKISYANKISEELEFLKSNGSQITISGRLFVSSFFNIFLLGDNRIITKDSVGIIHLPIFVEGYIKKEGDDEKLEQLRQKAVSFISSKTNLTNQQVRELNEKKLNSGQLMQYNIATDLVKKFEPLVYS